MVDAIERLGEVSCRNRRYLAAIRILADPFDSVEHGVLCAVTGPVRILIERENVVLRQIARQLVAYNFLYKFGQVRQ